LCDGQPLTWGEYQQQIVAVSGKRVLDLDLPELSLHVAAVLGELATRIDKKPRLFNSTKVAMAKQVWTCRHERAREDFGYSPRITMSEGVQRTFSWYREHGWV
jgi:nucleoside-diphosphate-sugar epimerase